MDASDGPAVQALLDEQAALRRVATLVASAGDPGRVFSTVTAEVGGLLGAQTANMVRYRHDGTADVIGGWNEPGVPSVPVGARIELDGETLAPKICRSGQPERAGDYTGLTGRLADRLRELGIRSGVGAPIVLDGKLWGAVVVSSVDTHAFAAGDEYRIAGFTELVAMALANAEAHEQLAASRARVVVAGDAERRRLERNLHDGAQQRLVALAIGLRIIDRLVDESPQAAHEALTRANDELAQTLAELRELARALHPAILSDHGLEPAIRSLMQRAPLPVELTFEASERPSDAVEVAAYYVIAESLTNVAKYAHATVANVEVRLLGDRLLIEVADDGVGGADHSKGSGLLGLEDRVAALGGRLHVESVPGEGTSVRDGGIAVSEGAAGSPEAVGLVYLAAFMLDVGESLLDAMQHQLPDWISLDQAAGSHIAERSEEVLYGDCPPEVAAAAAARLSRQSVAAIATPQTAAAWQSLPSTYLICEEDRAVPPPVQEAMAARASTVRRVPASHSPFFSRPDDVAEVVLQALGR